MRRIERFSRLIDCGIFRDFTWPEELPNFGRYNLIYGWNGTGKTTLSRILRFLEHRQEPPEGQIAVRINGKDIRGEEFPQATVQLRVFNRDFVSEVVFPVPRKELQPIYVFGKESVDKQKEVERLKAKFENLLQKLELEREKKRKAEEDLDRFCREQARAIKEALRSPGSKNRYNNYDRRAFRRDAEKIAKGDAASYHLGNDERRRLKALLLSKRKEKLSEVVYNVPRPDNLAISVSQLLKKTVLSTVIQSLKDDPKLAEWTRYGLALHKKRQSNICLFCQQSIPQARIADLEAHFSAEYERSMAKLDQKIQELEEIARHANELKLPARFELYDDLAEDYENAKKELLDTLESLRQWLEKLIEALRTKRQKPFEPLYLGIDPPAIDVDVVDRLNAVIRQHNKASDDFDNRIQKARDRLAQAMIADSLPRFQELESCSDKAAKAIGTIQEELERLKAKIDRLEREIIDHRQPAEELNEDLHKYLGHKELRLEFKDTGYLISRNGEPVSTLSEGETTAIALLYFLKSLRDRRFNLANGVVVLDDPISSLDANALYLAFGFIRERVEGAGQVFILTHNFTFFRQIRNWFQYLKGDAKFYMLECSLRNDGKRCSAILPLDPLLKGYESEYHYLFSRVYREALSPTQRNLEDNYVLPNIARRLLEAFLAFRYPHIPGDLWKKLRHINFDQAKKVRILRFVHTYSHTDSIGEPQHDPSLLGEAPAVLRDLLDLIKSEDPQHFTAMEKLVGASETNDWG